jgi:hypothetical protein
MAAPPPELDTLVAEGKLKPLSGGRYKLTGRRDDVPAHVWAAVLGMEPDDGDGRPVLTFPQ